MGYVALEGIEFTAAIGVYEEEHRILRQFSVDISVKTDLRKSSLSDHISDALNYELLLNAVRKVMLCTEKKHLLEKVCRDIVSEVLKESPEITEIRLKITKHHPFLSGVVQASSVVFQYPEDYLL